MTNECSATKFYLSKLEVEEFDEMSTKKRSTRPYVLERRFGDKKPVVRHSLPMSSYLLDGVDEAMSALNLQGDYRILLVKYKRKKVGKKWRGGDAQLFVTGTVEEYEIDNTSLTAEAELREETRLEPSRLTFLYRATKTICRGESKTVDVNYDWYGVRATDMRDIGSVPPRPQGETKTCNKVSCIVYGTEDEMDRLLTNLAPGKPEENDGLESLVSMSVADARSVIQNIRERQSLPRKADDPWNVFAWKAPARCLCWCC